MEIEHNGSRYLVLPSSMVRPTMSETAARQLLQRAHREGGRAFAQRLRSIVEDLGGSMAIASQHDVMRVAVEALMSGRLVAIARPLRERRLSEPQVVDLRSLRGDITDPTGPSRPTPLIPTEPPPPPLQHTFISFEVVDGQGNPAHGHYRIALDARVEEDDLRQRAHHYDEVREGADVRLRVEQLLWDPNTHPRSPVEPSPPLDPAVDPEQADVCSFEVVDEDGQPLVAQFVVNDDNDQSIAEGEAQGKVEFDLPQGGPATLQLFELHPTE